MTLIRKLSGVKNTDLMSHFIPRLLQEHGNVAAYYTRKEWFAVGTVSNFETLNVEQCAHPLSHLA